VAKRYSPYLNRFYERIKQRRGGGKAKIALARKLVKIVYDTLKNQWVFTYGQLTLTTTSRLIEECTEPNCGSPECE
ncbi:MAG TPA: hypothetical protein VGN44_14610, partial [Candidatus Angelobacter sp.]